MKSARAFQTVKTEEKENIIAVGYYWGDDGIAHPDGRKRRAYYEPWLNVGCYTDGILETAYTTSDVRKHVRQRKNSTPSVTFSMSSSCPGNSGKATITIKNISSRSVSGKLHFLIKERHVNYPWGDLRESDCVNRGMIPDVNGESVTIDAGESITKERSFTIDSKWKKDNCRCVAFLQKSNKEIVEGCRTKVNEGTPVMYQKTLTKEQVMVSVSQRAFKVHSLYKGNHTVSLVDLQGRTIKVYPLDVINQWITLPSTLSAGIHCLKIETNNKVFIKKIQIF